MSGESAASTAGALRVLWIESGQHTSASGLAWLRQRMQQFQTAQRQVALIDHSWPLGSGQRSHHDCQRLMDRIDCGVERIVVACVNRLDYPVELINFLQQTCPEIPLALASDSWWDGRRRTGLATPGHLSLPWYRWWDGWVDWLQGCSPALFEVAPAPWPMLSSRPPATSAGMRGLIVGNCRQTAEAWALAAATAGHAAACVSWQQFQQQSPTQWSQLLPQWVLWDDTCLDTIPLQAVPKARAGRVTPWEKDFGCPNGDGAGEGCCADNDEAAVRSFFERLSQCFTQRALADKPRATIANIDCGLSIPEGSVSAFSRGPKDDNKKLHNARPRPASGLEPSSYDGILGIVAVSMPRAAWAMRQCAPPSRELLVKPSGGQGLARMLDASCW